MSRRLTFALAAAALVTSSSALAWEPTVVGLDEPFRPAVAAARASTASAPADIPAARVTPELVSEAAEAASASGSAVAAAPDVAPAATPEGSADQVACVCPER